MCLPVFYIPIVLLRTRKKHGETHQVASLCSFANGYGDEMLEYSDTCWKWTQSENHSYYPVATCCKCKEKDEITQLWTWDWHLSVKANLASVFVRLSIHCNKGNKDLPHSTYLLHVLFLPEPVAFAMDAVWGLWHQEAAGKYITWTCGESK